MNRPQAKATQLIDDAHVCVTRFDFEPGAETGWHVHGMRYVITTITDCQFLIEEPGGEQREVDVAAGEAYRRDQGVEHNVINRGEARMSFIEIELKSDQNEASTF